ncbi:hypothetical protein ASPWEDRAFT_48073 [Aspergillus wentii DTO 134E9]|uniref:Nudix hydrolase domain-containing protein n=1 Tax=Aspergillus wentii DTO 134E9 TaxID=1073089 RepID=A0A1L9S2Y2_ASPWE|nr:uncharacterized protein ASPWEDRAFT_48073 [Aspergillus wentii DTO 134E9]KAI9929860.1 thiamine pyrophosphokinase [Aspergillus wentii]OJJ41511.1 hypothetical protein ASPWEDRAFT_48073 [Aspergillus wentii DTO 134E9]
MQTILDVVKDCDNFPYEDESQPDLWKFCLPDDPRPHGLLIPSVVKAMPWTDSFQLNHSAKTIHLIRPAGINWESKCTAIIDAQVQLAREKGTFPALGKPRHEEFPIVGARFRVGIDRSAFSMFGIIGRGVHMTVYVRVGESRELKVWIPQRNLNKATYPGALDNTVAGGMATGEKPMECLVREASEEAGMEERILRRDVRAAGTVTWLNVSDERSGGQSGLMNPGILYVYDMEVEEDVVFKPVDDDVHAFHLMGMEEVKEAMLDGRFKPASACVMIDFLIRHGIITAEEEEDYAEIVSRLHRKLPLPSSIRI